MVDKIGKNYFFRGSNPFVEDAVEDISESLNDKSFEDNSVQNLEHNHQKNRVFSYEHIKKYINQDLENKGFEAVDDFYLIDFSFLNLDGFFQIKKEREFFTKNSQLGEFKNYSEISPELLFMPFHDHDVFYKITENYHQNLTKTLQEIHQILQKQSDRPVIIYAHCNAGRDRTGLIMAAYRMLYKNMNLQEAMLKNIEEVGRNPESLLEKTMESYCFYLQKSFQKSSKDFCKKIQ
jgi:protein-tyrosine phosphatase